LAHASEVSVETNPTHEQLKIALPVGSGFSLPGNRSSWC